MSSKLGVLLTLVTLFASFLEISGISCGGKTSSKNIALQSPVYPPRNCLYTLNAYSSYVCQLRIDLEFNLAQPRIPDKYNGLEYAECVDDYVRIGKFKLCGRETNQHIYVPFNRTGGTKSIQIQIETASRGSGPGASLSNPTWTLRVNQLECPAGSPVRRSIDDFYPEQRASFKDAILIAPIGCTQYFPAPRGNFASFNYNNGDGTYPGNMNYAICFRRTENTNQLMLSAQGFQLGSEPTNNSDIDSQCISPIYTVGRSEDYLLIPQAQISNLNLRATHFCGRILEQQNVISHAPGSLQIIFNSDKVYHELTPEKGFAFRYTVE